MKAEITFDEFLEIEKKLEIRWGTIAYVQRVPKSNKLLQLDVQFDTEHRVVVTNLGSHLENEQDLKYQRFPFIMNLKPTKIMGIESFAMIMVSTAPDGSLCLTKEPVMGQQFPPSGSTLL